MSTHLHWVIGGGTFSHVRTHLALAAPAFGETARQIGALLRVSEGHGQDFLVRECLTRMGDPDSRIVTNEDLRVKLDEVVADARTKIIFMSAAVCDFDGSVLDAEGDTTPSGRREERLCTSRGEHTVRLTPADKLIGSIRRDRKDIFLVGFKTTCGATPDEQYLAGLALMKRSSCNLVLANDVGTRLNMVITPEQARYHEMTNREEALRGLVEMALLRSKGTFTRSTVVPGEPVPWSSEMIPGSLRTVIDHCIARGAYKPFLGSTVGHFAVNLGEGHFITSRRKVDFNRLGEVGLVLVEAKGDNEVIAHGSRPSVGGQSQRIIFTEHPELDCIVHAHVPLKHGSHVPVREQRPNECGSHECGRNTSTGLRRFGNLHAVMLDRHGPNIVFNRNTDPAEVISFIEVNFDLGGRTDGVSPEAARTYAQPRGGV